MTKTVVYYFCTTGNSLITAMTLAQKLQAPDPIYIPDLLMSDDPYADAHDASCIGFVFPVHSATIPEMFRGFIKNMPVNPGCYYFAISTYTLFGSNEFWYIDEILCSRGAMLNYAASVRMMGNFGLTKLSQATIDKRLEQMAAKIDEIAEDVGNHQENYF
jgi:flavodoxin